MIESGARGVRLLVWTLCALVVPALVAAAPITVTTDVRAIGGNAQVGAAVDNYFDQASTPVWVIGDAAQATSGAQFAHSQATQTSSVSGPFTGDLLLTLDGQASDSLSADAQSVYSVVLTLTQPFTYTFDALVGADFVGAGVTGYAQASAFLRDNGSGIYLHYVDALADAVTAADSGVAGGAGLLLPGEYWLWGQSYGGAQGANGDFTVSSSAKFALTLTPVAATVPEPATMALLGSGVLGILFQRRRRGRQL